VSRNRSALIVEGNLMGTGRVLIEHPRWPIVLSLSTAKAPFSLPGTESAKSVVLSVSN